MVDRFLTGLLIFIFLFRLPERAFRFVDEAVATCVTPLSPCYKPRTCNDWFSIDRRSDKNATGESGVETSFLGPDRVIHQLEVRLNNGTNRAAKEQKLLPHSQALCQAFCNRHSTEMDMYSEGLSQTLSLFCHYSFTIPKPLQ